MVISDYFRSFCKRAIANVIELNPPAERSDNHPNTYAMSPYPYGWYAVCLSHELGKHGPKPLSFFGKEFVAFRDEDGKARILDAYCPHMGAHLGHRGKTENGHIVCPFHGWTFDKNGVCINAPFAKKTPCYKAAHLKSYHTVETAGMVLMWFHINDLPPLFVIPEFPESNRKAWTKAKTFSLRYRSHVQEIRENFCDETHFHFVHRQPQPAEIIFETEGATAKVKSTMLAFEEFGFKSGPTLDTEATMYGPGIMAVRTKGFVTATSIALTTPIDKDYVRFRLLTFGKKSRFLSPLGEVSQYAQDFYAFHDLLFEGALWNHKIYKERPLLQKDERTIPKFRKWYKQFYETEVFSGSST